MQIRQIYIIYVSHEHLGRVHTSLTLTYFSRSKVKFLDFCYVRLVNTIILKRIDADPPNSYHICLSWTSWNTLHISDLDLLFKVKGQISCFKLFRPYEHNNSWRIECRSTKFISYMYLMNILNEFTHLLPWPTFQGQRSNFLIFTMYDLWTL